MQVKISYTADIKDVPKEVANVLNTVSGELEIVDSILDSAKEYLSAGKNTVSKLQLSSTKEILQKIFVRITDCETILDGYEKVLNSEQKNESQSG
jgi:hypothetical protein